MDPLINQIVLLPSSGEQGGKIGIVLTELIKICRTNDEEIQRIESQQTCDHKGNEQSLNSLNSVVERIESEAITRDDNQLIEIARIEAQYTESLQRTHGQLNELQDRASDAYIERQALKGTTRQLEDRLGYEVATINRDIAAIQRQPRRPGPLVEATIDPANLASLTIRDQPPAPEREDDTDGIDARIASLENTHTRSNARITTLQRTVRRAQRTISASESLLRNCRERLDRTLPERHRQLETRIAAIEELRQSFESHSNESQSSINDHASRLEQLEGRLRIIEQLRQSLENQSNEAQGSINDHDARLQQLEGRLPDVEEPQQSLDDQPSESPEQIYARFQQLEVRLAAIEGFLPSLNHHSNATQENDDHYNNQLSELTSKVQEINSRLATFQVTQQAHSGHLEAVRTRVTAVDEVNQSLRNQSNQTREDLSNRLHEYAQNLHDTILGGLGALQEASGGRLEALQARITAIEGEGIPSLEDVSSQTRQELIDQLGLWVQNVHGDIDTRLGAIGATQEANRGDLQGIQVRIAALEGLCRHLETRQASLNHEPSNGCIREHASRGRSTDAILVGIRAIQEGQSDNLAAINRTNTTLAELSNISRSVGETDRSTMGPNGTEITKALASIDTHIEEIRAQITRFFP
ncbi:MAG: hypothetical protein Q9216_002011 [Gyalolechia sp. 2 TL-2023]